MRSIAVIAAVITAAGIGYPALAQSTAPPAPQTQRQPETLLTQAPTVTGPTANERSADQGGFDPWTAQGHELDNIADRLSACVEHDPPQREACLRQAIDGR